MKKGPAKKLTIYVDDGDRHQGRLVHEVLLELFLNHKISGVTLFRGIAGYGSDKVFHTPRLLRLVENMPLKLEVVDTAEKIKALLPDICRIVEKGLVEVSDTEIIHSP